MITFGRMVEEVIKACSDLDDIEIIDLQTIKPFDQNIITQSVSKTHKVLCVEEGCPLQAYHLS